MAAAVSEMTSEETRKQSGSPERKMPAKPAAKESLPENITPRDKPIPPGKIGKDGKYQSSIDPEFLDQLHSLESQGEKNRGYEAANRNKDGKIIAYGRYQIQTLGLRDAGYKNSKGEWTGKDGIESDDDFLKSPKVQDRAIEEYVRAKRSHLENNGSLKHTGQTYTGIKDEKITISEAGLIAAAHRIGQNKVRGYLEHMKKYDWKSNFSQLKNPDTVREFKFVETRLRLFQNTPVRRKQ